MKEETLDRLTSLTLDCKKEWQQTITLLSVLHRRIGRLEGKIDILSSELSEEKKDCTGFELILIAESLGILSEIHFQLQKLGITNFIPEPKDNSSLHDLEIETQTTVTSEEE